MDLFRIQHPISKLANYEVQYLFYIMFSVSLIRSDADNGNRSI
jgi:hypothetical protein